ncbi:MAG: CvpA family protein [Oscillospiraceae bacterium]|nr:CvpA family protein [Oscillospiraceae bacterium]
MEQFLPLLLDLAALLFVIAYIRLSARRGFVRTVVQLVGFFVSLFLANALSGVAATYVFEQFIRQGLTDKISEQILSSGSAAGFLQSLSAVLESIPSYLLNALEFAGLPADLTLPSLTGSVEQLAVGIVDQTVGPTCIALFSTVFFLLFFSLLMFLTRMVARGFTGLRHIPIVGPINSVLGGCVGAVEGVLYLYLIVTIASLVLALTGDRIPYLNRETLENTWLLRLFLEKNALGSLPVPDFSGYAAIGQEFLQSIVGH